MPALTVPFGPGQLHLTGRPEDSFGCRWRRNHRLVDAGAAGMALRRTLALEARAMAAVRQLLLVNRCTHDVLRLSDDAVCEQVVQLIAVQRLFAVGCAEAPKARRNRLPPASVPLHLGVAGTDFAGCWHHRSHVALDLTDVGAVRQLLQRFGEGAPLQQLRRAVRLASGTEAAATGDAALSEQAVRLLLDGQLCAVMCPMPAAPTGMAPLAAAPPRSAPPRRDPPPDRRRQQLEKTWIEVRLVRSRDRTPVAGAHYRLELADGSVRKGRSDDDGVIYEKDVEPGSGKLALLDHDRNEWRRI